jgi:uncharacterized protein YpmB
MRSPRKSREFTWAAILIPIFAVVFAVVLFIGWKSQAAWERTCTNQGGTVNSHTDWVTTYDRDGHSRQNSNTTYYCIRDGHTISIR